MTAISSSEAMPTRGLGFRLTRLGPIMTPDPADPHEVEGVLNPATARGTDGTLYLFPRIVAEGNFSRIARAMVDLDGDRPVGVTRAGIALAPQRAWERGTAHGGVEDPRISFIPRLGVHVMTYIAFGPLGPKPAIAVSADAVGWRRLGPVQFAYDDALDTDLNLYPNKDVVFFPEPVPGPDGAPAYAMLHRPMWDFSFTRPQEHPPLPAGVADERPSIWISYIPAGAAEADITALTRPEAHREVARPEYDWETLKIGAGPAPFRVREGWLLIHHGVSGLYDGSVFTPQQHVHYSAGAMILDAADPATVLARTPEPLLSPETADETTGAVPNVVFPTATEQIGEHRYVFYGMGDCRIGVARFEAHLD
jgi:predicted GH43/DUF377 family glycosyl hydrolase